MMILYFSSLPLFDDYPNADIIAYRYDIIFILYISHMLCFFIFTGMSNSAEELRTEIRT